MSNALTTPGDIIASIPGLVKHTPSNTTVFLVTNDSQVVVAGGVHPDDPHPAQTMMHALSQIGRGLDGKTALYLIDFGTGADMAGFEGAVEHWWVTDGEQWWCRDVMCAMCGPMPHDLPSAPPPAVVEAVTDGVQVGQSRSQALARFDALSDAWSPTQVAARETVDQVSSADELIKALESDIDIPVLAATFAKVMEDGKSRDSMYMLFTAARRAGFLKNILEDLDLLLPHVPQNQGEDFVGTVALGHYLDGDGMAAQHLLLRCRPNVSVPVNLTLTLMDMMVPPQQAADMIEQSVAEVGGSE